MAEYSAPLNEMRFVLNELAGVPALAAEIPAFEHATSDVVDSILEEGARFAGQVLSPLNRVGDREGVRIVAGEVKAPTGFREAYQQFASGGWNGLGGSPQYGGQGLPHAIAAVMSEMWSAANTSFSTCPELALGVTTAFERNATPELRGLYLPRVLSGEWTGTMCLTEPQAGSDLAAVQTRAEPFGDHYKLFGRKIFITWGDHDMAANILHLVLARAPDAPPGVKGISLFIVPKYLVKPDGSLGARNDIHPVSVEHKLGMHASPTCVLALGDNGGAEGWLVGRLHDGLAGMFIMMNHMRVGVGVQALGIADRAYQQAVAFARERVQGRSLDGKQRVTIIHHADVRRMLLTMRALTEAARALTYVTAAHLDRAHHEDEEAARRRHLARVELLTPVVKGWITETAQEVTGLAVQVHGGMGFIEETGVAQYLRDVRITTIYEGTTGIQALDLVGRKVARDSGQALRELIGEMLADQKAVAQAGAALAPEAKALAWGAQLLGDSARALLEGSMKDPEMPYAVAFHLLMLLGTVCGGWQMARAALAAQRQLEAKTGDAGFLRAKMQTTRFYMEQIMPRAQVHATALRAGSPTITQFADEQF